MPGRRLNHQRGGEHQRQGNHQRPADHLPAAELPRHLRPFRIAEAAGDNCRQHQQIAAERRRRTLRQGESHHQQTAQQRKDPESALRTLAAA